MIIVTGADNTGKTTLVEHLIVKFPQLQLLNEYHTKPPKDKDDWIEWLLPPLTRKPFGDFNLAEGEYPQYLADRFYLDEFVYGPICRGSTIIDEKEKRILDHLLLMKDPLIIHTGLFLEKMSSTFGDREQYPNLKQNIKIMDAFTKLFEEPPYSMLKRYVFDFTYDKSYEAIDKFLEGRHV